MDKFFIGAGKFAATLLVGCTFWWLLGWAIYLTCSIWAKVLAL